MSEYPDRNKSETLSVSKNIHIQIQIKKVIKGDIRSMTSSFAITLHHIDMPVPLSLRLPSRLR